MFWGLLVALMWGGFWWDLSVWVFVYGGFWFVLGLVLVLHVFWVVILNFGFECLLWFVVIWCFWIADEVFGLPQDRHLGKIGGFGGILRFVDFGILA